MLGLEQERRRKIFALALPIMGGMVSQNVLNLVDTLMVSRLGRDALAAVGFGGFANFLCTAFITGMSVGVQALVARREGEDRIGETAVPLNGGLVIVAAIAVPLSVLLIVLTPYFFPLLASDKEVVKIGVPYLQVRLAGMLALGWNFAFRGFWNGINMSQIYLRTLIVMHAVNVPLSYVLIFGKFGFPEMGATGAGLGTCISTYLGCAYYFALGRRYARDRGFLAGRPSREVLWTTLRLAVPSGLQRVAFAAGLTALLTIIDRVGTAEVAATSVLINVTLVAYLPGLGLGLAAASLVGQALGRRDVADARRWGWDVVRVAVMIMCFLGLPMALFPGQILNAFFDKAPEVGALALWPLRLVGMMIWADAVATVLLNAVMGAGATSLALWVSSGLQWVVFLPVAYLVGPILGTGLIGIWIANVSYRAVTAVIFALIWRSRVWVRAEL